MHTDGYVALAGRSALRRNPGTGAAKAGFGSSCSTWRDYFCAKRGDRRLEARVRRPLIVGDRL